MATKPIIVNLAQAMADSPTAVYLDRKKWGDDLFDKAVAHHTARRLRADLSAGTTTDVDGQRSRFVQYDWGHEYENAPHHVYFDFFRGAVCNSCSRLARGLAP